MSRIKTVVSLVLCMSGLAGAQTTQTAATSQAERGFELLGRLVGGSWTIDAAWSDGQPLKARQNFEWGPGKRFIRSTIHVRNPDGTEYLRYETMYGIREGRLVAWGFTSDGSMSELEMAYAQGDVLAVDREINSSGSKVMLRQTLKLTEGNRLAWKVWTEREGSSNELMNGVWVRS